MITLTQYWMGRDVQYRHELTREIEGNAQDLLDRVNPLLTVAETDGITPAINAETGNHVASGWRPFSVNLVAGGAPSSRHLKGMAVDLRDYADQSLAWWCWKNTDQLVKFGLWMEHPGWTPSWVHLQSVPPRSSPQVRIFIPNLKPASVKAFPLEPVIV